MLKYTHTRLLVQDFKTSFRFYQDILGFTPTFGDEDDVYADFETGGSALALFPRAFMADVVGTGSQRAASDGQDSAALIFGVDDVDRTYRELRDKGVPFLTTPEDRPDWGIRTAHFRDPDGNLLEIYSGLA